ncbi:polysaccharide deacetylase family protein [Massilia sp. HP4]|uniref:polysaccharide deacetylase family protein n=1 Tax=Massilia sp. HP4 TaxID=2562316 RepID=UPI0010BF94B9|nr:polysaccharide deacetylase family protein [Massilia sp. HP4]
MNAVIDRAVSAFETRRYRLLNRRERDIVYKGGAVSFTFDDFPHSALDGAAMLEERGWRGTFYLSTALAGHDSNVGQIADLASVMALHARGHEIGNHTDSHLRCQGAPKAVLKRELKASADALAPADGNRSFAFPFGAYDASALNVFSGSFDTLRTVQRGVNHGRADLNLLKANPIYESTQLDTVRMLLDETVANDGWLIFYTHDVCARPSDFGCTPARFDQVLSLVAQRGLAVETVAGVFASL